MAQRDYGLDVLKGLGCLGMVFAHYTIGVVSETPNPLSIIYHLSGLAPVIFFSVTGVTTVFQARKYPLRYLVTFYLLFAIFGLAYNFLFLQGLTPAAGPLRSDIPQIIAASVIAIACIERWSNGRAAVYLGLAGAIGALHLLVTRNLGHYPLSYFLTEGSFPLVPWLAFPLLGVAAYRARKRVLLAGVIAMGIAIALVLVLLPNYWGEWTEKWNMTWQYMLVTLFALCWLFLIVKLRPPHWPRNPLLWFGKRSLLFLFLHLLLIQAVLMLPAISNPLIAWPLLIAVTALLMWCILALDCYLAPLFTHPIAWAIVLAAIIAMPFILSGRLEAIIIAEGILGVLLGTNYQYLAALMKARFVPG